MHLVAKRATTEIAPQIEVLELDARPILAVASQQRREHRLGERRRRDAVEQRSHAWQRSLFGWIGFVKRFAQSLDIASAKLLGREAVEHDAGAAGGVFENPLVGSSGHLDAVARSREREKI